jgi:hypothetical protein
MLSASQLSFPGSRILAQWWRQLQPFCPESLHVGFVHVHRLEAIALVNHERSLEPLAHVLLQALAVASPAARLQQRLGLPMSAVRELLRGLHQEGLVQEDSGQWSISAKGQRALECGKHSVEACERRVFPFLERAGDDGQRRLPPHFVPLAECGGAAWHVHNGLSFDATLLSHCVEQSTEWKQSFGFPSDVCRIEACGRTLPAWQSMIVDRPEQIFLALVTTRHPDETRHLVGFAAQVDQWMLDVEHPVLRLPLAAAQVLWPTIAAAPDARALREAWVGWCRERSFPVSDADASELDFHQGRLDLRVPDRFLQRLRTARSEILRGESALLLTEGHLRPVVHLQISNQRSAISGQRPRQHLSDR